MQAPHELARRALVAAFFLAATVLVAPSPAQAAMTTTTFTPVADVALYSSRPDANLSSDDTLVADTSPKTKSFLRFEVAGLSSPPTGAVLRLWITNASSNGPEVRPVTSAWDPAHVTYRTRPSVGSTVADVRKVSSKRWLEYDVSELVTGIGPVDMAVVGDSSDGTDFASANHQNATLWPQLVVETEVVEPPPPPPPPPPDGAFSFGLIGDTGYTSGGVTRFLNTRGEMNSAGLTFTAHVGDIKLGGDPCTDNVYTDNRDRFDGFGHPLIYTPGDNEWRDCSNKVGRLAYLRQVFFSNDQSRGSPSMTVARPLADFPENALWHVGPLTFVTLHTVGPDNNAHESEFATRNAANIAWMQSAFDAAAARGSAGIVVLSHANPGFPPDASRATWPGFRSYLETLRSEVQAWGKPVIYVHGDTHTFRIDHPTVLGTALPNLTRVEVYGPSDEHWIRVDYNPLNPALFTITGI